MSGTASFDGKRFMSAVTRTMRVSHIYSAAPVLLLMFFFSVTGLYLNHPEVDEGSVVTSQHDLELPEWALEGVDEETGPPASVVLQLLHWLDTEHQISGIDFTVEYDDLDGMLIIDLAGPDGSTLVEVLFEDGVASVDRRKLSFLARLNNLHRAKHVSGFWVYLADFSAVCMLVFCFSGIWLIAVNKLERTRATLTLLMGCGIFVFTALILH